MFVKGRERAENEPVVHQEERVEDDRHDAEGVTEKTDLRVVREEEGSEDAEVLAAMVIFLVHQNRAQLFRCRARPAPRGVLGVDEQVELIHVRERHPERREEADHQEREGERDPPAEIADRLGKRVTEELADHFVRAATRGVDDEVRAARERLEILREVAIERDRSCDRER